MNDEVRVRCTKDGISVEGARDIGSTSDTQAGSLIQFLRIAECWWNTYCEKQETGCRIEILQPDPDWKTICEKCKDGEILPDNCEYFGEPNGCNSPLYGQHPKEEHGNAVAIRDALVEARKVIKAMGGYWARITLPIIDDALSKPPSERFVQKAKPLRNCDVPLVVDGPADNNADKAWIVFKKHNPDAYFDVSGLLRCIDWLLAPAEEQKGETDGK